jgi:hypothetical protein
LYERTASLVAPLCVPFIAAPYFSFTMHGAFALYDPVGALLATVVSTAFGYLGMFSMVLPSYRYLTEKGLTGIWVSVLCGFVAAEITAGVLVLVLGVLLGARSQSTVALIFRGVTNVQNLPGIAIIGVLGMMVGAVFWLIARPDRSSRQHSN